MQHAPPPPPPQRHANHHSSNNSSPWAATLQQQSSSSCSKGWTYQSVLLGSGSPTPPILNVDDMVLLATSAAGLQQQQLDPLERYCQQWGLTLAVKLVKTKFMRLSGTRTQQYTNCTFGVVEGRESARSRQRSWQQ